MPTPKGKQLERSYRISQAKQVFYETAKGQLARKKISDAQKQSWNTDKAARSKAISEGLKRHYAEKRAEKAKLAELASQRKRVSSVKGKLIDRSPHDSRTRLTY